MDGTKSIFEEVNRLTSIINQVVNQSVKALPGVVLAQLLEILADQLHWKYEACPLFIIFTGLLNMH